MDKEISAKGGNTLWRNHDYLLLWMGQSISALGTGISQVAFPILIFVLTNNVGIAGLIFSCGQLPFILFSLPAGALIDRWNRKRIMILCTAGLGLCLLSIAIIVFSGPPTFVQLALFFVCSFLIGTLTVFYGLAELAALTQIVPKAQLSQALTQNEVVYSTVSLTAPPIGTFLLSVGRLLPFVVDSISYAVLLVSLFFIRTSFREERTEKKPHLLADIREGLRWVWHQPILRLLIVLSGYLEVIISVNVLVVPVIAHHAGFSLGIVGFVLAAAGIGNILGAIVNSWLQRRVPFGYVLSGTLLLFVLIWPFYALVANPYALGIVIAILSVIDSVAYLQSATYRLTIVPDQLQGRVGSIARLVIFGSLTLGPAGVGLCLQRFGVTPTIAVLWGGFILLALLVLANRQLRRASLPKE
ncbi:MAG TPA: MFS transporter [Ktedonobacteraceae bacterium]|nr:MFS transporter [Ktedonobacteraceae bacterium]